MRFAVVGSQLVDLRQWDMGIDRLMLERHIGRVRASLERLDDEIYEAAVSGQEARVRYLEWCREQVPRWVAEGEQRSRRERRAK